MAEMAYFVCDVERVCTCTEGLAEGGCKGLFGHPLVTSPSLVPGASSTAGSGEKVCSGLCARVRAWAAHMPMTANLGLGMDA